MNVLPNSGAARAGLRGIVQTEDGEVEIGDIIVAIDGQKVSNNDDIFKALDKHQVGDTVNVDIYRDGRQMTVPVRLIDIPATGTRGVRE